jgi:hypothetical protein
MTMRVACRRNDEESLRKKNDESIYKLRNIKEQEGRKTA